MARKLSLVAKLQLSRAMANAALVSVICARRFDCHFEEILSAKGRAAQIDAQRVAIYICVVELRGSARSVAAAFDCDDRKIRRAVVRVEERRGDDVEYDEMVSALVRQCCPLEGGNPIRYIS